METVLEDQLYIGDSDIAQNEDELREKGIQSVLGIAVSFYDYNTVDDIEYKRFFFDDSPREILPLQETYEWIKQARKPVLVHCDLGLSRSPAICLYYLMKTQGWSFDKAHSHLQKVKHIDINANFIRQLRVSQVDIMIDNKGWLRTTFWLARQLLLGVYYYFLTKDEGKIDK